MIDKEYEIKYKYYKNNWVIFMCIALIIYIKMSLIIFISIGINKLNNSISDCWVLLIMKIMVKHYQISGHK